MAKINVKEIRKIEDLESLTVGAFVQLDTNRPQGEKYLVYAGRNKSTLNFLGYASDNDSRGPYKLTVNPAKWDSAKHRITGSEYLDSNVNVKEIKLLKTNWGLK
jgi:hypothetical protein